VRGHTWLALTLVAGLAGCAVPDEPAGANDAASNTAVVGGAVSDMATGDGRTSDSTAGGGANVDALLDFLRDRELTLPQFAGGADGGLFVAWREPTEGRGGNLMLARRGDSGAFEAPVRVNDIEGSVGGGSLDEGRPAIAVVGDQVAVAWTARGGDIRAAVSNDGGRTFAPSLNLNSDEGAGAYRGFVDIALDAQGVAHAAWIDGRFAPRGAEEPAELFYARIAGSEVTEINLTEQQADSICGCCRIDVAARPEGGLRIAFRNTGGGYRDIWRIEAGPDGAFGEPARLGPPMWQLNGCPVIGPLNVGEATLWAEASIGKRRILAATDTSGQFEVVLQDDEQWAIERPPRVVVGAARDDATLLLVPGRPAGKLLRGAGSDWRVAAEGLPRWAMSAALIGDRLVLIGELDGELQAETRPLDF
jgi:hypothetical protein